MPITSPIFGAEMSPSETVTYCARGSVGVISPSLDYVLSSVDVLSDSRDTARTAINSITASRKFPTLTSLSVGNVFINPVFRSANIVAGDSFMILADILALILSGTNLGSYGYYDIQPELKVNGTEIAIKSFQYQVPTGKLGSILNITLARPDPSVVPAGANIRFALKVVSGGAHADYVLVDNGKLQERDYTISYQGGNGGGPNDEVTISSLDVIADKFGLAPRRPVTMFDPRRVRYDDVNIKVEQMTRDSHGSPILPLIEPVYGLSMHQILQRACTGIGGSGFISPLSHSFLTGVSWGHLVSGPHTDQTGCGFSSMITNIPDYPVRRADFTLEGGWFDGAQPTVAMYAPVYFVHDGRLFIINVDALLPYGITPHIVSLAEHKSLSEHLVYKPDANAVLLTYQYNGNDPSEDGGKRSRDVFTETVESEAEVEMDAPGYYKISTRRWDREFYFASNPTEVLDTLPLSAYTETQQAFTYYSTDGTPVFTTVRVSHTERIDYLYEGDLKIRHIRETEAAIATPNDRFIIKLFTVEREECNISWTEDPNNPGAKLQSSVRTDITGRCAFDPDNTESVDDGANEFVRMIPVLLAQSSGILGDAWIISDMVPIKSIRENLRNMKGSQYDVEVIEVDLINNTHKTSYTNPVTGSVRNDPYQAKSRNILITDPVSEAAIGPRIPIGLNAYELPRARAIELANRTLYRFSHPLINLPITLAGVDFVIARGSVIKGQKRSGYTGNYFVTGYSINGTNLGKKGHRVSQTIEATELLAS